MALFSRYNQEPVKLDLYDKKLIFYLSQNSRMRQTDLARRLRISSQRVHYKIERLKEELLTPAPFLNYPLLGIPSYIIYVKALDTQTISTLMRHQAIYFMMQTLGEYEWVLHVLSEDIMRFCREFLGEYHFAIHPVQHMYADDYNPFHLSIKPKPMKSDRKYDLDKKDYVVLKHLVRHPLDSIAEIARTTGLDRKTIRERISRLERSNYIQKFRYGINVFKLGMIAYILHVEVVPKNKRMVLECLRENNYSGFIFESYTSYIMQYIPPSHKEVLAFTKKVKCIDPTVVIRIYQNTELYKVDLAPPYVVDVFKTFIS